MTAAADRLHYSLMAIEYAEAVISGERPACQWIKLACQRFMDDLDWQADDGFAFRYDAPAAERACRFIERLPHIKGRWARERKRISLEPFQAFIVCNIFGWIRKKDGFRRFRRVVLIMPRKNAKSTLAAGIGLYMFVADHEHGAEVYSGATTEKQAWEVFGPSRLMVKNSPALRKKFGITVNAKNMVVLKDGSKFEPIIGDPGDGASPTLGIVDEYHEHKTDNQFDTLETGMGARDQPMMLVITTAGDNITGPCYALQERAQQMLHGTRPADDLFAMIYTIDAGDDWQTEIALQKANPNYGVSVGIDFLKTRRADALGSPRKQAVYKTKHLNIWVQSRDAYFDVEQFKKARDEKIKPQDFADWEAVIAIDLAEKRDLAWVDLVFKEPVDEKPRYARFGRGFIPSDTVNKPENDHLQEWEALGLLEVTEGAVTDNRVIKDYIEELLATYDIREVVFDRWRSRQMGLELSEMGFNCVEFATSPSQTNEPMREMDAAITEGRLIHDGSPVYEWQVGNVVNGGGRRAFELHRPDKEKPENKIDGPVCTIMALARFLAPADDDDKPISVGADYSLS